MKHRWLRAVPVLSVLTLLALAALGPSRRARASAPAEPAAPATVYPNCSVTVQWGAGGSVIGITNGTGVTQPLIQDVNVSACSLQANSGTYTTGTMSLVSWDPLLLIPDPTTVALRTRGFSMSDIYMGHVHTAWTPPLVVRTVPRLAERPRSTVAMDFVSGNNALNAIFVNYQTWGPDWVPLAYYYASGGTHTPLSGPHPLLSHGVCGGDSTLQVLRIVQSVVTTSTLIDTTQYEVVQRFRVPVQTRLRWVELAFGSFASRLPYALGRIAILDAEGDTEPPATLPAELVGADYSGYMIGAKWDSHYDFDQVITLEPLHDYWLLARIAHCHGVYVRARNGTESPDFVAAIGPLATRLAPGDVWQSGTDAALCFRLVGEPTGVADVPSGEPRRIGLRIGVSPNPATGPVLVRWAGARGTVRFEVLDARGRRVLSGADQAGTAGGWTWSGSNARGARLPAGVYFVRASDEAGQAASERVVLVR